ncbi:hypothetical protein HDU67_008542 [Dinochytrium kinnereticum]|nr:hypothetical protein HDU67_008542 [Dinochytrium kinnereticum]
MDKDLTAAAELIGKPVILHLEKDEKLRGRLLNVDPVSRAVFLLLLKPQVVRPSGTLVRLTSDGPSCFIITKEGDDASDEDDASVDDDGKSAKEDAGMRMAVVMGDSILSMQPDEFSDEDPLDMSTILSILLPQHQKQ